MSTGVGSFLEALLAMAYGLAPDPISATIVYGVMDGATGECCMVVQLDI